MPGILTAIPSIISAIGSIFGINTDDEATKVKMAELQAQITEALINAGAAQVEVNQAEAAAPNRKWITWREMVGYTCAAAFAYHFLIQQVVALACNYFGHPIVLPNLEISELMTVLMGMLGLGGLDATQHYVNSAFNSPQGVAPKDD